jgi:energy-converting hydrogenase B subunit D
MTRAMTEVLQVVILVLVAGGATLVATIRGRVRQVVALSAYGVGLAVLFLTFQAPDVALSELVVGAVALPLILLLTIARVRWRR